MSKKMEVKMAVAMAALARFVDGKPISREQAMSAYYGLAEFVGERLLAETQAEINAAAEK